MTCNQCIIDIVPICLITITIICAVIFIIVAVLLAFKNVEYVQCPQLLYLPEKVNTNANLSGSYYLNMNLSKDGKKLNYINTNATGGLWQIEYRNLTTSPTTTNLVWSSPYIGPTTLTGASSGSNYSYLYNQFQSSNDGNSMIFCENNPSHLYFTYFNSTSFSTPIEFIGNAYDSSLVILKMGVISNDGTVVFILILTYEFDGLYHYYMENWSVSTLNLDVPNLVLNFTTNDIINPFIPSLGLNTYPLPLYAKMCQNSSNMYILFAIPDASEIAGQIYYNQLSFLKINAIQGYVEYKKILSISGFNLSSNTQGSKTFSGRVFDVVNNPGFSGTGVIIALTNINQVNFYIENGNSLIMVQNLIIPSNSSSPSTNGLDISTISNGSCCSTIYLPNFSNVIVSCHKLVWNYNKLVWEYDNEILMNNTFTNTGSYGVSANSNGMVVSYFGTEIGLFTLIPN